MRHVRFLCWFAFTAAALAQSDRGTITGTVSDPANAVVPGAGIIARSLDTGSQYPTATTATGNYTIPSLPAGVYEVKVEAPGFKKLTRQGITVQVAQITRIDLTLEVGATTESITVDAEAPLLKTESAEQSTTITRENLTKLPLNFGATQGGAIRNPLAFVNLTPGASIQPGSQNTIRVNGTPNTSFKIMIDGMDATNPITQATTNHSSPSVDSVEEFTLQASNFAAEFGQVVGGLFNFTARSGTNRFHGAAYDYLENEALNAGQPFTTDGKGHLVRQPNKKNDFGLNIGGPLIIPRLYNGHNRTFFFFNIEAYIDRKRSLSVATVPTEAMRNGDFSAILTNRQLAVDPLARPILENTIYDPATQRIANGAVVRDPFPGNIIPISRIDPVAAKIQALIPAPTNSGLVNNWSTLGLAPRNQVIPSLKVDHNLGGTSKLSFYTQYYRDFEYNTGPDGLPVPITAHREKHVYSLTSRLNYDQSITPTLLLHAGAGEQRFSNPDTSPKSVLGYDAIGQLGLIGASAMPAGFPQITGLGSSLGGMSLGIGPTNANHYFTDKPTAVLSLTNIRGSHTYKAGAEFRIDTFTNISHKTQGAYVFGAVESGLPSTNGQSLGGGVVGFPYASFLLGAANSATVNSYQDPQLRKQSWSLFLQDTWKVTRRFTLDYGLRWDYQGPANEIHDRLSEFSPSTPNPSAGGLPGATVYAGHGEGRCNCDFTRTYPYAFGPRVGAAYQIDPKTVLRAGWGIAYGPTAEYNYITGSQILGVGFNQISFTSPSYGDPAVLLRNGLRYNPAALTAVSLNPGIRPDPGQINSPAYLIDSHGARPPRINQWSIGVQREITRDLMVEAAYVGNRGVWEEANSLIDLNGLTPQRISTFGLNINNAADRTLLTSRLDSQLAQSRAFKGPYPGYPLSLTVGQTLRPFPQFGSIPIWWAPLGDSWYDSLQTKATKRYSHGFTATAAFTWQKELTTAEGTPVNDVYNRRNQKVISPSSQPLVFVTAFDYQVPAWGFGRLMKVATAGWTFGGILKYASGVPILSPIANNAINSLLFRANGSTFANRVPGQALFLKDPNCRCFDPGKTFVLNPAAWIDPAPGQFGVSAAYYNDYRTARRPDESMSLGRVFRIRESMNFSVRAEFFNVFNRTYLNNPDSTNAASTQRLSNGQTVSGFGRINTGTTFLPPRTGQMVARFQW